MANTPNQSSMMAGLGKLTELKQRLLVGAALTRRPDLFRAVLCGFPDVDILRFNQFTTTNNMPALLEYGDAAVPAEFHAIKAFSPYQNVRSGTRYPAVMVWTGDLDTRVPPLAGRKFAAALQAATASGRPVILRYLPRAGHAGGNGLPLSARLRLQAEQIHFLERAVSRLVAGEQRPSEEEDAGVQHEGAGDAEESPGLHFLSVLIPTLGIPILRTSSRRATTCLKSAPASLFRRTFGSLALVL